MSDLGEMCEQVRKQHRKPKDKREFFYDKNHNDRLTSQQEAANEALIRAHERKQKESSNEPLD